MDKPRVRRHRDPVWQRLPVARGAPPRGRSGRRPRLLVAPAVIGLALASAACGGGPPRASVARVGTTTTALPAGSAAADGPSSRQFVKYAGCMRSHGVLNFPDDPASPVIRALKVSGATSSPEFQAAAQACEKFAHHGTPAPQITSQEQADYLRAASCMRNHGIAGFPDPVFLGGNVNFPIPHDMNTKSTQFRRAREVCEGLIPPGLPYSREIDHQVRRSLGILGGTGGG
jgi:hypothetical protein